MYTGLLKTLPDDDAMLAAVLAHEIAHVAERHSVENLGVSMNPRVPCLKANRCGSSSTLPRLHSTFCVASHSPSPSPSPCRSSGLPVVSCAESRSITDSAGVFINWLNDIVAQRAYSRRLEMEADKVGLDLMAAAGYDPRAALDLWEMMQAVEADAAQAGHPVSVEEKFALLRTHPTSEARHRALEGDMPGAMKLWREHLPRRKQASVSGEKRDSEVATSAA